MKRAMKKRVISLAPNTNTDAGVTIRAPCLFYLHGASTGEIDVLLLTDLELQQFLKGGDYQPIFQMEEASGDFAQFWPLDVGRYRLLFVNWNKSKSVSIYYTVELLDIPD